MSCKGCRAFRRQLVVLQELGRQAKKYAMPGLPAEARQRISRALREVR